MNRFCKAIGVENPIIQGPMAWISTAPLVAAVSNAGGLGVLGVGFAPDDFVIQQVAETKKLTTKPFAINTVMIPENLDRLTGIIKSINPPVIYADTLGELKLELCEKYFEIWHSFGCKVIVKAGDMETAVTAEKGGADALIVKGWEGGGHTAYEATTVLVPQAADVLSVPVVASGGIADGRGMAAAIALGADAIEMGTVFMACSDAAVHPNVKQSIVDAKDMSTVITGTSTGEPCRQFKNKLSDKMETIEAENVRAKAAELLRPVAESSLKLAMIEGDMENGAVMAGQIAALIKEIRSAEEIISTVLSDAQITLKQIVNFSFSGKESTYE
ncbi:nitronate monooxygenase [Paenibacillus sp. Lou8.1]|uniref:nitronate monooxygenase n=1 Tax=Paenibacillus sp. Lou8.1 TaxID=2962041 RepID=UPI0020B8B925|nr:nitronate monooxygenase [Paenibacillus sp. Lou8.1]MCP3807826.1 nitronate monooxygenase [Paenibacillus sp. Lou8.1]